MKSFHGKTADRPDEYVELNDQELAQVIGGQSIGQGYDDKKPKDRCYYDKKHHRRYCYDRHGHRYESH
ncbi:bacteriocin [Dictyobacter halimunensis]